MGVANRRDRIATEAGHARPTHLTRRATLLGVGAAGVPASGGRVRA